MGGIYGGGLFKLRFPYKNIGLKRRITMKEINVAEITNTVKNSCIDANYYLSDDIRNQLTKAREKETFDIAKSVLNKILINADIARNEKVPMCQDTGMTCVFIEIGQEVHVVGGDLSDAIKRAALGAGLEYSWALI